MKEAERIRVIAREGYNLWAESYDATPNPVVALDARHTIEHLPPQDGERILDVFFLTSAFDDLPEDNIGFEAALCALVGEHLKDLDGVFFAF